MGACFGFLGSSSKRADPWQGWQPAGGDLGLGRTNTFDRSYLWNKDLVEGRLWSGGLMDAGSETQEHQAYLAFFRGQYPGLEKGFAWIPIWRLAEGFQNLDEIVLAIDPDGTRFVKFNGKGRHGTWLFENGFLDILMNCRYGEPRNKDPPDTGKWVRFTNLPGTRTWIRCEAYDEHTWVVILTDVMTAADDLEVVVPGSPGQSSGA